MKPDAVPSDLRRRFLLTLAGACVPSLARADDAPPQVVAPPAPAPPQPPVAAPQPARAPGAPGPIDRTKTYFLFFDQTIDVASMRTLRRELALLTEAGVAHVHLVLNSPGGLLDPMLITYSFIRSLPMRVDTHAQGFVMSAATVLFLAGQGRTADRTARFLFHPSQGTLAGSVNEQQVQDRLTQMSSIAGVMAQIYKERTQLTDEMISQFERSEVIMTADQALGQGIIQSVTDLHIPGDGTAKIIFLG